MNKYLKFEYWNTCDLGNVYYQGGQHFWFYLDGDVLEPFHEDTEDGQENGEGDFVPTYRRQMKRYRIKSSLIPEHLIDAIQRMKLHDNIELTFKTGEVEQVYNLDVEPEWQFEKYCWQGTVTITFDMDEKVVLGACCDNLTVGAGVDEEGEPIPEPEPIPDLYWVMSTGSNVSGVGSYANPWQTFAYATTQATTPGDIIHMKANDIINETLRINLAVGVSIVGVGDTSEIRSTYAGAGYQDAAIYMESAAEGTMGNQSISYVKLNGVSLAGKAAITVYCRSNVKIHHVTVVDFSARAVMFHGADGYAHIPGTYATSNELYNCTFTNSATRTGCLNFSGQDGILIHDNTITNYQRAVGHDPTNVQSGEGYNKDVRFYNNKLYLDDVIFGIGDPANTSTLWNFQWESWDCMGGYQVYDNEFHGGHCGIDVGGTFNLRNAFAYSWNIHDNLFEWDTQYATEVTGPFSGVTFEGGVQNVQIHANHFKNLPIGINSSIIQASRVHENIYIHYNIMENMGWGNSVWGFGIWVGQGVADAITRNINIFNNVISSGTGAQGSLTGGIAIESSNSVTDIDIKNNIIQNVVGYGCIVFWDWTGGHTIDNIDIKNNIYYNNVNANDYYTRAGTTVTNLIDTGNIEDNPDFVDAVDDFHLVASSPAINAGVSISMFTDYYDYDGVLVEILVEIGAFEY